MSIVYKTNNFKLCILLMSWYMSFEFWWSIKNTSRWIILDIKIEKIKVESLELKCCLGPFNIILGLFYLFCEEKCLARDWLWFLQVKRMWIWTISSLSLNEKTNFSLRVILNIWDQYVTFSLSKNGNELIVKPTVFPKRR